VGHRPGIGADERARIFEEFYQVPGTAVVTLEQKKGLGLGLAIVKRLCALMDAPLGPALGGRPRLGLHRRAAARQRRSRRARPIAAKGPVGITLDGRLIVIVEDEPAVREGLEVLLTGWGATIVSLASVAAARAWADAAAVAPALVIADYRLETRRDRRRRDRRGARALRPGVPAIVVTGSTMTGHEKEALENDFHVLIKPVLPNKLRAMIAFKLAKQNVA
jgi:CheY-like chemotaxis protein